VGSRCPAREAMAIKRERFEKRAAERAGQVAFNVRSGGLV